MHDYDEGHFVNCQRLDYSIPSPLSLSSIILDPWANIKCLSHFSMFLIPTRIRCVCFQLGIETLKLRGSCNIGWSWIQRIFCRTLTSPAWLCQMLCLTMVSNAGLWCNEQIGQRWVWQIRRYAAHPWRPIMSPWPIHLLLLQHMVLW